MPQEYLYGDYIKNLSGRLRALLDQISFEYNFDVGEEFEIAICDVLEAFLPEQYGICRGFIVSADGRVSGDDIIIYDKARSPTLRLMRRGRYDRKERIPIESVYAYIEAKNTIDSATLPKAILQVVAAKELCHGREPVAIDQYDPYVSPLGLGVPAASHYPSIRNPVFGMVFGRNSVGTEGGLDQDKVFNLMKENMKILPRTNLLPDLIVSGPDHFFSPRGSHPDGSPLPTIFFIPGMTTGYQFIKRENLAHASGLLQLLAALDFIRLGRMPWAKILNNSRFPGVTQP